MGDHIDVHRSQRRYPPEMRERAVRMVVEAIEAGDGSARGVTRIAQQLDIGTESLRGWVEQAEGTGAEGRG